MREQNISAGRKRRQAKKTDSNHSSSIAPNLLERDFTADAPNKKWMTDMTFIATGEEWLYLAGVIDAYSRRLIGWAMGSEHDAELVKQALHMALVMRQKGLQLLEQAGLIRNIELQPRYDFIINGKKLKHYYKADFRYEEAATGLPVVEDAKGFKTKDYRLKKELVEALYGIEIIEV